MTLTRLALRSLVHYWRTNLATVLGIATAVAVLAGAYTVGRSVQDSLRDLANARLGRAELALISEGFFREGLAPDAPFIALEGAVTHDESGRRASRVAAYGVDRRYWQFQQIAFDSLPSGEALLSPALAREVGANANDTVLVRIPRISTIPVESLHGQKEDPGRTLRMRVHGTAREFSLRPTQGDILAVYVPLDQIQREFDLGKRANNALLPAAPDLQRAYRLEDIGLRVRGRMLERETMVFPDELVEAVMRVDPAAQPVFTYLVNSMNSLPYSLVSGMGRHEGLVLTDWAAKDLRVKPGDGVRLEYYVWDPSGRIATRTASLPVSAIVPLDPIDRELAPEYPGITGAETVADWDPPFPIDLKRIRPKDEEFWKTYRATPKAYVSLSTAQKLWRTRYGGVTSIRVSEGFHAEKLRASLDPRKHGLNVVHVRSEAAQASRGSTNFGEYFLYFSFFLVISALLLAGLFFRFGLEQRSTEIRMLRALGWPTGALRRLFLTEGVLLAAIGGLVGALGAVIYAALVLLGLRTWWVDAVGTRALSLHYSPTALGIAMAAALLLVPPIVIASLRAPRQRRLWLPHPLLVAIAGLLLLFAGGAGGFFGGAFLLLTSALLALWRWLRGAPGHIHNVRTLGFRYTAARPGRSVLCIALIAAATFLIVAVESFRRDGFAGELGYRYYGESALPIISTENLPSAKWLPLRLRPGDDTSCLNLYAPQNPRVLGVPASYLQLPPQSDGKIPAAVDANTLEYVLHKKVGDLLQVGGAWLRIVHTLKDSVFQSELLIPMDDFTRTYPEEQGYRVFLIDAPEGAEGELESALSDYGLDVTRTSDRIAAYHRVENTYLSTFQSLGALGLLLGTVGLAAVLLRNVLERRRELALLRSVGYNDSHLSTLILAENAFLLVAGLAIGVCAALVAVVPTVMQRGGTPPWMTVALLVALVLAVGIAVSLIVARGVRRAPLLDALRSE